MPPPLHLVPLPIGQYSTELVAPLGVVSGREVVVDVSGSKVVLLFGVSVELVKIVVEGTSGSLVEDVDCGSSFVVVGSKVVMVVVVELSRVGIIVGVELV